MKTFKQLAAEFDLYQVQDIPEQYKNEYYDYRINLGNTPIPEFLTTLKGYETALFYKAKEDTHSITGKKTYYLGDDSYILCKQDGSDILMVLRQEWRTNKYWFMPYYGILHKYNNIANQKKSTALANHFEPNKIGVFTEKKVNDWFKYNIEYLQILDALLNTVNNKNEEQEKIISDFIASVPGCEVSTWDNKTDVNTPLFRVLFIHYKAENYLNKEVTFKGTLEDITKIENALK